jgi:phage terminase large subunit-like protein
VTERTPKQSGSLQNGNFFFTHSISDRQLISKIYKELKKLDIKTQLIHFLEWGIDKNKEFSTDKTQMAVNHLKKCSTSLDIREMQIKVL